MKLLWFIEYTLKDNNKRWVMKTDHFTLLTCSLIVDNNSTRQQEGNKYNLDFFKKIGACVFWAP